MTSRERKQPLYRKVNTQTHGVRHDVGGDYRTGRKGQARSDASSAPMRGTHRRGLDYTPLFKFLLSKVGSEWNVVYSEAISRLDRPEPIFLLVARHGGEAREIVRVGESSYFSGLYVDDGGVLRIVNPDLKPGDLTPSCNCCTHTLNGVRFDAQG